MKLNSVLVLPVLAAMFGSGWYERANPYECVKYKTIDTVIQVENRDTAFEFTDGSIELIPPGVGYDSPMPKVGEQYCVKYSRKNV